MVVLCVLLVLLASIALAEGTPTPSALPTWLIDHPFLAFGSDYEELAEFGVNRCHVGFCGVDFAWARRRAAGKDTPLPSPDPFADNLAAAHRAGMKAVCDVLPCYDESTLVEHPEWRVHWEDGPRVENLAYQPSHDVRGCYNSPFGDRLITYLVELAKAYPIDGICFDGLHSPVQLVCYCKWCKEQYGQDTGLDIPKPDPADVAYRRYVQWQSEKMISFFRRLHDAVKAARPEIAFFPWSVVTHPLAPTLFPPEMARIAECPMLEWYGGADGIGCAAGFFASWLRATCGERMCVVEPYLFSRPGEPVAATGAEAAEADYRACLIMTRGAIPSFNGFWKPSLRSEVLRTIGKRMPFLVDTKSVKWAAVLVSEPSRSFHGPRESIERSRHTGAALGVFRAALEEHLPIDVITDLDLDDSALGNYSVLVLADAACLSKRQIEHIRRFVDRGGGLVATQETSRFDELGVPWPEGDFALRDLFGASYKESLNGSYKLKMGSGSVGSDLRMLESIGGRDRDAAFMGRITRVAASEGSECQASVADLGNSPAVICRQSGHGRVAYLPVGFDSSYYARSFPYQRHILAAAMRWAARKSPAIRVQAPLCVQAGFYVQGPGERLVVHLLNDLNTTSGHGPAESEAPQREEVVPIRGVKITFADRRVKNVRVEPEGRMIEAKSVEDGSEVVVPELHLHSMIVADMRSASDKGRGE